MNSLEHLLPKTDEELPEWGLLDLPEPEREEYEDYYLEAEELNFD